MRKIEAFMDKNNYSTQHNLIVSPNEDKFY